MARHILIIASLCAVSSALATAPLKSVDVTPRNENQFAFSVVLSGRGEMRTMVVFAPSKMKGDCIPAYGGTELRASDGKLVYSQMMNFGPATADHEIRGELANPSHSLTLWINYLCPESHWRDSARYTFSSLEWEKSGRMQ